MEVVFIRESIMQDGGIWKENFGCVLWTGTDCAGCRKKSGVLVVKWKKEGCFWLIIFKSLTRLVNLFGHI